MDYLKYVRTGSVVSESDIESPDCFDTHGLMARLKIVSGSINICSQNPGTANQMAQYPVEAGETFEFVGRIKYFGTAEIRYVLFDKA